MINYIENITCESARPYLIFHIQGDTDRMIPVDIQDHILNCLNCKAEILLLKEMFNRLDNRNSKTGFINDNLTLHYAYAGKPITCAVVKPFLPSLLLPGLEINIPTPITVHIEHCPSCSQDFNTLKKMNLVPTQLGRLAKFFANIDQFDPNSCQGMNLVVTNAASLNFQEIPSTLLRILCLCPDCRNNLYQERQNKLMAVQFTEVKDEFPCERVNDIMLFDYVVPYGMIPAIESSYHYGETLRQHARQCPVCLERMQILHKTLYSIAENDSGIVTLFNFDHSSQNTALRQNKKDLYPDWPISVSVTHSNTKEEIPTKNGPLRIQTHNKFKTKRFIIPAAAAAVIFLALSLFLYPTTAKGLTLKDIYKALTAIDNVHISRYEGIPNNPIQELWFSKTHKIRLYKFKDKSILWDLSKNLKMVKLNNSNSPEITPITEEELLLVNKSFEQITGITPFEKYQDIPQDAVWKQITDKQIYSIMPSTQVYELQWQEITTEKQIYSLKKWRCYIDIKDKLIQVELYSKGNNQDEYILQYTKSIKYIDSDEFTIEVCNAIN